MVMVALSNRRKLIYPLGMQAVHQLADFLIRLACDAGPDNGLHFVIRPRLGALPNGYGFCPKPVPDAVVNAGVAAVA